MSLSLYFLRHGETTHSQTGGYCDELDPELTPSSLKMVQAFADAYQSNPLERRVCQSDEAMVSRAECVMLNKGPYIEHTM